jgi:hypothetical protein
MTHQTDPNKPCCPKFDVAPWDNKTHVWQNKFFIKDSIPQLFHMPWPPMVGKLMSKMWKQAEDAGSAPDLKDFLCLAYDPSPWKSEFYIAVNKEVPGAENVALSGTFLTKVFDGPFNSVPKWIKEMEKYASSQNKKVQKYYFYYTTCPKCAKIYGHNYVVAFAQVEN